MEAWRRELQNSIAVALNDSNEEEKELLIELLVFTHGVSNSEEEARGRGGGSTLGRLFVHYNREGGAAQLYDDYFVEFLVFEDDVFRRRYRMRRELFLRLVDGVVGSNPWFR